MGGSDETFGGESSLFDLLGELTDLHRAGGAIDLDAFRARAPHHAREIEDAYQALVALEAGGIAEADDPRPPPTPDRIDAYAISREIGRGGMGIVYEAWQPGAERRVALKVLPAAAALDARRRRRFEREARAASQLRHDHIVPIYQVALDGPSPYFAMPLIEGASLAELLADARLALASGADPGPLAAALLRGRLGVPRADRVAPAVPPGRAEESTADFLGDVRPPPDEADPPPPPLPPDVPARLGRPYVLAVARLGLQAAEALEHAHDHDVVHRDVKPGNLLLDLDGRLWVADFGLARIRGDLSQSHALLLAGTLHYMSPEQASPEGRPVDHRTDVYSLGVTLYELLTWRRAVPGSELAGVLARILHDEPASIRRQNRAVPRDLETIVRRAIAKDPADRFATAGALAEQLRRLLDGRPLTIRPPSPWARVGKWAARQRVALLAWAATIGLVLAGSVAILAARNRDLSRAIAAEARERSRAERHLDAIRDLVSHSSLAAEHLTAAVPLGTARLHAYLAESVRFLEEALARLPDARRDPGLRHRAAIAHFHLARSFRGRDAAGNRPIELRHLDRSIGLLRPLVARHPEEPAYRVDLARGLQARSQARLDDGAPDGAEADALEALRVAEALARDFPGEPDWIDVEADARYHLAAVLHRRHDGPHPEAVRHGLIALRLADRLAEEAPGRPRYLANARRALVLLGTIAAEAGRPADAERAFRRALEVDDRLVELVPDDRSYPFDRTGDLLSMARLLLDSDRPAEAAPLLRRALDTAETYAGLFPDLDAYRLRPIELLAALADAHRMLGHAADASSALADARSRLDPLLATRPDDPTLRTLRDRLLAPPPTSDD